MMREIFNEDRLDRVVNQHRDRGRGRNCSGGGRIGWRGRRPLLGGEWREESASQIAPLVPHCARYLARGTVSTNFMCVRR